MSRLVMSGRPIVLAAGLVGLFGAGWWSVAAATAASEPQVVHVVADDSSWDTSGTSGLQAGWVSFTLETREGEADHGLALLRLKGEATVDVLVGAEDFDQFLELAEPLGGLVGVTGAATHTMIARLDAGSYAIIDFGELEEGPNFLRGMTASFEVAAGDGSAGVRPHSDGEIVMREFAIDVPDGFSGQGTYLVRNDGGLFHELNIGRFDAGTDPVEVIRQHAETGHGVGATEETGMWVLAPDAEAYLQLDLEPGNYAFVCFLSDPEDQPSHALHGMYTLFTVQ